MMKDEFAAEIKVWENRSRFEIKKEAEIKSKATYLFGHVAFSY